MVFFMKKAVVGGVLCLQDKGTIQHPGFWLQKEELRKLDLTVWVWGLLRGKHPWLTFCGPAQVVFPSCFWGVSKLLFDRTEAMCIEPLQNWTKLNEKVCSCLIYESLSSRPSSFQMAASLPPCPDFLKPCYMRPSAGQQKLILKTQSRHISFNPSAASTARSWPSGHGSWSWTNCVQIPAAPLASYVPLECM